MSTRLTTLFLFVSLLAVSCAETSSTAAQSEPDGGWLIGVDYVGVSLVERPSGDTLSASDTIIHFFGRDQISVSSGGCSLGGGSFTLANGRLTDPELIRSLVMCDPSDRAAYEAVNDLILAAPEIRAEGANLLLESDRFRLELEAGGPGVTPTIESDERFIGVESDIDGINPDRIELTAWSYTTITASTPTCEMHGATDTPTAVDGAGVTFTFHRPRPDPCEYSPDPDRRAQMFFTGDSTARRGGDELVATSDLGSITFRLAADNDPPMAEEEVTPPPLETPDQPDRALPPEAGRPSQPWFSDRVGSTEPGGVDIPFPGEEWEISNVDPPSVSVVGRGGIGVRYLQEDWNAEAHSAELGVAELGVVEGPTPVTVKLYRHDGQSVVETGETATVMQYRYAPGEGSATFLRLVVWVLEGAGETVVVEVAYPDFPGDSPMASPDDRRNQALTGLDPVDLLLDVRFFD